MSRGIALPVVVLFLVTCTVSIHLQHHSVVNDILKQLQQRFMSRTRVIKNDIERVDNLVKKEQDLLKKIALLEQLFVQQRNNIIELLEITKFSLNQTSWTCEAFGPLEKNNLLSQELNIKKNITDLLTSLKTMLSNQPAYTSTIGLAGSAANFVNSQKSSVNTVGRDLPSDSLKVTLTTNFNAGLWAFGKSTVQQFRSQLHQQKNKITQLCPLHKPYADKHDQCRKCPDSKPHWLLSEKICVRCAQYNEAGRQCLDKLGKQMIDGGFLTNFAAGRERIMLFDKQQLAQFELNQQNLPLCPASAPFFNSTTCIDCPKGLYFSLIDQTCRSCPSGQYHDSSTLTCKQQFYYSRTSIHSWSSTKRPVEDILEAISLKKSNSSYAECPSTAPFSNDTMCLACIPPTHFSYDSLACDSCPKGTILNLNEHRCLAPGNLNYQTNPINTTNLIYNGKSQQEWLNLYYQNIQKNGGITDCPKEEPYFDGVACIVCPKSSPYFNLDTLICQQCQGTTLYNALSKQCLSNDSNRAVQSPTFEKMAAAVFA